MSIFVTKNFKRIEFQCPCGCHKDRPLDPKLIFLLQSLRDKIGKAIYISIGGGLRCKKYNKKIGGYIDSPHLYGKATDIHAKNMDIDSLAKQAEKVGFSRVALYPFSHFIHVDTIEPYPSASWVRGVNGKYHYFKSLEDSISFAKEIGYAYREN